MSKDMVKQVRITADGDIELFDAELVSSFGKLMDITFQAAASTDVKNWMSSLKTLMRMVLLLFRSETKGRET